ncbi:MAG: hypothetical protein HYW62_03370 [Candidatus Levybacteria bacterium]|nr:hypothetical protein [Candidatus Levybacteria bacterium]
MIEQAPSAFLTIIHADVTHADEETERASRMEEELIARSKKLFEQATQILKEHGEVRQKKVPIARIGNYLEIPVVPVEFGGKKADLVLLQDFTPYADYPPAIDKVVLKARFGDDSQQKQLFLINRDGRAQNWLGGPATIEQMDMVEGVLSLMKDSLLKVNRQREAEVNLQ